MQLLLSLYRAWGERSPLESVALKAAAIMAPLMLQQPNAKSTYRENSGHLLRRMELWEAGNIDELLDEGSTIQAQLKASHKVIDDATLAKRFAAMIFNNNFKGAMSLVTDKSKGGILKLDDSTKSEMKAKHPEPEMVCHSSLISGVMPDAMHPIFYTALNGDLIKRCALRTRGGAGVSQQEDMLWQKMVTSFKDTSSNLCNAVAVLARRLASEYVDPAGLDALLANRGIAIDKCPGLRPVGVGEIVRRIVGKAIMQVTGEEVQRSVGALQLCAGHPTGVEAAIHAMRNFLEHDDNDGILLIDADNAFNRVNRAVALWNVQYTCPAMKFVLINAYRTPTRIFMTDDNGSFEFLSQEGTTQGCPLAMAMYAMALAPLLKELHPLCHQVWYADDATGCDTFVRMRAWFDALQALGPKYGYFPKPSKCILLVKPDRLAEAQEIFKGTDVSLKIEGAKDSGVEINTTGTRHLGAAVGTHEFKIAYVNKKIDGWIAALKKITMVAASQPHAAFSAFTQCMQSQWTFLSRSMPQVSELFERLEDEIRLRFLPALLRREVNDFERDVLSLPARLGGLGITKPHVVCVDAHEHSMRVSAPLIKLIMRQELDLDPKEMANDVKQLRAQIDEESEKLQKLKQQQLMEHAPDEMKLAMKTTVEKGASSWLTATPLFDHDTVLHKGDFVDAIYMRYGWTLPELPLMCPCQTAFSLQHALDCKLGGFRTRQHNEIRDVIAQVMRDAGHTVETEPALQKLSGEEDGFEYKTANTEDEARSDIKVTGFWRELRHAFFDVKVVSPFARSYSHKTQASILLSAEKTKMREYKQRIREVEHGDFNPLVFTTVGAMAPQCHIVVKKLAEKLSIKQNLNLSVVTGWLRVRLSFALLRTSLQCIRGSRRKKFSNVESNIDLAVSQARMSY